MLKDIAPIYHGKRTFIGLKDLVISFYTHKCQFECTFCDLPNRSAEEDVPTPNLIKQIHWVFDQYQDEIGTFKQFSVGNEGSILDSQRFHPAAMQYLLEKAGEMSALEIMSFETRPEYASEKTLKEFLKRIPSEKMDITVGFETQDDYLRNEVLKKHMKKSKLEDRISLCGNLGIRFTSYVMLKPGPTMTEEEGVKEATKTIEYLHKICERYDTEFIAYLNPTYVAPKTPLARIMSRVGYKPPRIQSALRVILAANGMRVPIYTGLWSEGLADEDYTDLEDYDKRFRNTIKQFNKTQDPSVIKQYKDLLQE